MKILKRIVAIFLVVMLCGQSFAAVVSDNDGSAFITKAEFDSLKNNFQAQIDSYNSSIDSKIDGAIASYLSGISLAGSLQILISPAVTLTYRNDMQSNGMKQDEGIVSVTHQRLACLDALTSVSTQVENLNATNKALVIKIGNTSSYVAWNVIDTCIWRDFLLSFSWTTSPGSSDGKTLIINKNKASIHVTQSLLDDPRTLLDKLLMDDLGIVDNSGAGIRLSGMDWKLLVNYFAKQNVQNGENFDINGSNYQGKAAQGFSISPVFTRTNSLNMKNFNFTDTFGSGWAAKDVQGIKYLVDYNSEISIMNSFNMQNYTYYNAVDRSNDPEAWNDEYSQGLTYVPELNFVEQNVGTNQDVNTQSTLPNSDYVSYQASQIRIRQNDAWGAFNQLGSNLFIDELVCFDDSCTLDVSEFNTIQNDNLKFNRTGYYIEGNEFKTKNDNYVNTGDIKYKKLIWQSEILHPSEIAVEDVSAIADEPVSLGGGVPIAYAPENRDEIKFKLEYEVTKDNGAPITINDGSLDIKIELSDVQFKNGEIGTGGQSLCAMDATVNSSTSSGMWTAPRFSIGAGSMIWLNGYVKNKKGYNLIIKNITTE